MKPNITIDDRSTPSTVGYEVWVEYGERREEHLDYDVYILSRDDGTPYLVLVGEPDLYAWQAWRSYAVDRLLTDERGEFQQLTMETPHAMIVTAAVQCFLEDKRRATAA